MQCVDVIDPLKTLHVTMGGTEPFVQSAVRLAADLVQIDLQVFLTVY